MRTAIMQPYIFPYIGYYQLINSVDNFVILDDVNYINKGWINRNNILLNGEKYLFTIPIDKASQNKLICETKLNFALQNKHKLLKTIEFGYKKAPFFDSFFPVLANIILHEENDLTAYIINSFNKIFEYLQIKTNIIRSSEIKEKNALLKAQDRIIEICEKLSTTTYINLPGGKSLYNHNDFEKKNIALRFIEPLLDELQYKQYNNRFIANLSFVDIAMFNSKDKILNMLQKYDLTK